MLPGTNEAAAFDVFAPEHTYADESVQLAGAPTLASFALDESAKYFFVLVAMCEPRLRDASSSAIPTVPEILERLRGLPSCRTLTRSAVNFHIGYLATTKLRAKTKNESGSATAYSDRKADWQRAALVATAVRFSLVTEDHLTLLPSPLAARRDPATFPADT